MNGAEGWKVRSGGPYALQFSEPAAGLIIADAGA